MLRKSWECCFAQDSEGELWTEFELHLMGHRERDWIQAEVNVSSKPLLALTEWNYLENKHHEDWFKELGLFGGRT